MTESGRDQTTALKRNPGAALVVWITCTLVVGLIPFAVSILGAALDQRDATWVAATERGELLILAVVLCSAGVGEVLLADWNRLLNFKITLIAFCIPFLILGTWWFAEINDKVTAGQALDTSLNAYGSLVIFILSVVLSSAARIVAEI